MTTNHPTRAGVVLIVGDHIAAAKRDVIGLATRTHNALSSRETGAWFVLGRGRCGKLNDVIDSLPADLSYAQQVKPGNVEHASDIARYVVLIVGAADAKGGGPPLHAFASRLLHAAETIRAYGMVPLILIPPPCPNASPAGFDNRSRRFLRRILPVVQAMVGPTATVIRPDIPDAMWGDQLTLRPPG